MGMRKKIRNEKRMKHLARKARVARQVARGKRPRLTVFRSSKHIYAQLVDSETGRTIATISTRSKQVMGESKGTGNLEGARLVGRAVAQAAQQHKINEVIFNRNGFLYHGRVKALAEAAREAGLRF
jgi:large subunit ribosomal protein L18